MTANGVFSSRHESKAPLSRECRGYAFSYQQRSSPYLHIQSSILYMEMIDRQTDRVNSINIYGIQIIHM